MKLNISNNKTKLKEYFSLFLLITIVILIIFNSYIIFRKDYLLSFNNDHLFQTPQFYQEYANLLRDAIKTKSLPFYSFNTFLGTNFYSSKLYYCTGTIFLPLLILLKNNISLYMLIESILCIYISFFTMYVYLKEMDVKNKKISALFAIIYAVGGCATIQFCYPMFHRFYAFLPLLFLGVEKYLNKKQLSLFSIAVCILFLQNYYLLFSTSLFLPFYFIFSCYIKDINKGFHILKYLILSLKLILAYVIGFLMSAIITIPGFIFILNNNRLSYNELSDMITWPFKTWLSLIYYSFLPIAQNITLPNPFEIVMNTDNSGISYYYSIYNSTFAILGFISLFFNLKNKENRALLILFLILFSMIMFLPFNSVMVAFTTPTTRVMFLLSFLIILIAAKNIDNYNLNNKFILYTFILLFTISTIITLLTCSNLKINLTIMLATLSFVLGILYFSLYSKYKNLVSILVIIEITFAATSTISGQNYNISKNDGINPEFIKYYKDTDSDLMYRQYIDYREFPPENASILNQNVNLLYDYMSLFTYDSTYENSVKEFVDKTNSNITEHVFNIQNPSLWKMLGVKYVGITDGQNLDDINRYEYVYDINHIHMYKMIDYNHIGHTYSNFIPESNINDLSNFDWNNTLIIPDDLYLKINNFAPSSKDQLIINNQLSNNNFVGSISCDSDEVLFISIPYDKGWKFYVDGNLVDFYKVNYSFIGIPLNEGEHCIEAWFVPQGFKLGFITSCFGIILFTIVLIKDIKNKCN